MHSLSRMTRCSHDCRLSPAASAASADLVAHLAALRPPAAPRRGRVRFAVRVLHGRASAFRGRGVQSDRCGPGGPLIPQILDLLASGALSPTSVRLLRKHLTDENHEGVLARASGRSRQQLES
jgi:hypothetical protein